MCQLKRQLNDTKELNRYFEHLCDDDNVIMYKDHIKKKFHFFFMNKLIRIRFYLWLSWIQVELFQITLQILSRNRIYEHS